MMKWSRMSTEERFWSNVTRGTAHACWPFARVGTDGYGMLSMWGQTPRQVRAHRFAWQLHNGSVPHGMYVCHHCDNRACVNPGHLFLGTHTDNMRDMFSKGRRPTNPSRGEAHRGAKLTDAAVRDMRTMHSAGVGSTTLGKLFGVSETTAVRVVSRKVWAHVR